MTTILSAKMSQIENSTAQEVAKVEMESKVPKLIGALVICFCIAWLAVILRIISRRMKRTALKSDDFLIITSLVCSDLPFRCRTDESLSFRPLAQHYSVWALDWHTMALEGMQYPLTMPNFSLWYDACLNLISDLWVTGLLKQYRGQWCLKYYAAWIFS